MFETALKVKHALRLRTRVVEFIDWSVRHRGGKRIAENWLYDQKFGGWCGGVVSGAHGDASRTQSCDYHTLREIFRDPRLRISRDDVLVDVGCGKGRVLNFWLLQGYRNPLVGIELNGEIADRTRARLSGFPNVDIKTANVLNEFPSDGTVFFLYNPFGLETMRGFVALALERARLAGSLRIVYLNPRWIDAFPARHWKIEEIKISVADAATLISARKP